MKITFSSLSTYYYQCRRYYQSRRPGIQQTARNSITLQHKRCNTHCCNKPLTHNCQSHHPGTQETASHSNTRYNTHTAAQCYKTSPTSSLPFSSYKSPYADFVLWRNTLQHTATHCNTLQHTAAYCSTLQHTATHCNTLQHTATHCNTLQHTATHSTQTLQITATQALPHHCQSRHLGPSAPTACFRA